MELSKIQMQKLRQTELDILQAVIHVCEELGIQYFVVQGTLLGAVRHKGFIPWDDDIDIGMLRRDYEIFIQKGQALLLDQYFIQTHGTDPEYPHGFAKVRNKHTAFVETTSKNLRINHGIYIDVFPFDFYPEGSLKKVIFETKKLLLRYRIRCSLYIPEDRRPAPGNAARNALKIISCIVYPSLEGARDAQDKLYQCEKKGKYLINNGSPWGKKECIPAEWLNRLTTMSFEGIEVNVPFEYDKYLKHVYGDYMQLPPPEKRISHHFICAIDFTGSYSCGEVSDTE